MEMDPKSWKQSSEQTKLAKSPHVKVQRSRKIVAKDDWYLLLSLFNSSLIATSQK